MSVDTASEDNNDYNNSISISIPNSITITPTSHTHWSYNTTASTGYVPSIYSGMGSTGAIGASGVNFNESIVVHTRDGKKIDVADTIEKIANIIGLIIPQKGLIEKYPALKSAYDEYEKQLSLAFIDSNPVLKDAMESYKTMETILKNSDINE
jgi:hypothetical protein